MISVIIPAKDAAQTLPACLDAILNQEHLVWGVDYEVIVVDDGSTDGTAVLASTYGVQVISQPNAGPAAARNRGALLAVGEILAFTDADCIPTASWLDELVRPFADQEVMGVKGAYLTHESSLTARFVQCEYSSKYERMRKLAQIDFIDTYSAAYRRELFLNNGGFDPVFRVPSVEDQEFSFRLARKGYKLIFQPSAQVIHRHDLNAGEYTRRKFIIGYWKAAMLRWLPEKTFSDSHTPPAQRWQIIFLAYTSVCALAGLFWQPAWWLAAVGVVLFFASSLPFLQFIAMADRGVLWIAPGMLVLRAASLAAGIVKGIFFPPANLPVRIDKKAG